MHLFFKLCIYARIAYGDVQLGHCHSGMHRKYIHSFDVCVFDVFKYLCQVSIDFKGRVYLGHHQRCDVSIHLSRQAHRLERDGNFFGYIHMQKISAGGVDLLYKYWSNLSERRSNLEEGMLRVCS